jgi:hypothetical protein
VALCSGPPAITNADTGRRPVVDREVWSHSTPSSTARCGVARRRRRPRGVESLKVESLEPVAQG